MSIANRFLVVWASALFVCGSVVYATYLGGAKDGWAQFPKVDKNIYDRFDQTVYVKYHGYVNLQSFDCRDINRSSFIERVCYDKAQSYMIISLKGTYYHDCELPNVTFDAFLGAPSMGQFYNQNIKGTGSDGPY